MDNFVEENKNEPIKRPDAGKNNDLKIDKKDCFKVNTNKLIEQRPRSTGFKSFLNWFKKVESLQKTSEEESNLSDSSDSSSSNSSASSTATVASFAFLPANNYKPYGDASQPEKFIASGPYTETYHRLISERNRRRNMDKNLSLRKKYSLYSSGTLPSGAGIPEEYTNNNIENKLKVYDTFSLPAISKNNMNLRTLNENRKTASLSSRDAKIGTSCHVKGKRRAPQPPNSDFTKSYRKKRHAPPPPIAIGNESKADRTKHNPESTVINKVKDTFDNIPLQADVPKSVTVQPVELSPKPWYKRQISDSKTKIKNIKHDSAKKKTKHEYPDVGFFRCSRMFDSKKNATSEKTDTENKVEKRISCFLPNISELDREAAEIIKLHKNNIKDNKENNGFVLENNNPSSARELIIKFNALTNKNTPTDFNAQMDKVKENNNKKITQPIKKITANETKNDLILLDCSENKSTVIHLESNTKDQVKSSEELVKSIMLNSPNLNRIKNDISKNEGKQNIKRLISGSLQTEVLTVLPKQDLPPTVESSSTKDMSGGNESSALQKEEKMKLRELLKEMKNSLPKRPKPGNNSPALDTKLSKAVEIESSKNLGEVNDITSDEIENNLEQKIIPKHYSMDKHCMQSGSSSGSNSNAEMSNTDVSSQATNFDVINIINKWQIHKPSNSEIPDNSILKNREDFFTDKDKGIEGNSNKSKLPPNDAIASTSNVKPDTKIKNSHEISNCKTESKNGQINNQTISIEECITDQKIEPIRENNKVNSAAQTNRVTKKTEIKKENTEKNNEASKRDDKKPNFISNCNATQQNAIYTNIGESKTLEPKIINVTKNDDIKITLKKLEMSIADGDYSLAANLAKELALLKVNCSVTTTTLLQENNTKRIQVYIEDQVSHQGPIPFTVEEKMTIRELKMKLNDELQIPTAVQRWIIGKHLTTDDNLTVAHYNGNDFDVPLFLYVVASDKIIKEDKLEEKKIDNVIDLTTQEGNSSKNNTSINVEISEVTKKVSSSEPKQNVDEPEKQKRNKGKTIENVPKTEKFNISFNLKDVTKNTWICSACTLINSLLSPLCSACGTPKQTRKETTPVKENKKTDKNHYLQLISLDNADLVKNTDQFECPICFTNCDKHSGVVLRECLHSFCKECLINTIRYSEEVEIKCPYRDDNYSCDCTVQEREIKAIVDKTLYEQHLAKSVNVAENKMKNTFHCKSPNCRGWCIFEENVNDFHCPVCKKTNCLTCQAIHEGKNCKEYQKLITDDDPSTSTDGQRTKQMLDEMVSKGEAMICPSCQVLLMKKWGCDWLRCSMCKTEICWVTRGPRWGAAGKGDLSGGCQCGVNGVKCHPKCNYCH